MSSVQQGVPGLPQVAMVDKAGNPTGPWYSFFVSLWTRTGGATGTLSVILDNISSIPGSILYRGSQIWQGLNPAAQYKVLRMGTQFPEWDTLDGNSFGNIGANLFLAAPFGGAGVPSFRNIETADLETVAGQIPGTQAAGSASAGNVGEYDVSTILAGSGVALTSGTPANIGSGITLTAGDWDISLSAYFQPQSGATLTVASASLSTVSATVNNVAGFYGQVAGLTGNGNEVSVSVARKRFSVAATTTVFFVAEATFSGGTLSAFGELSARRAR